MKIMVIDDEPDIRTYLLAVLEDNGYETCSGDGKDSVREDVEKERPDLIILDIMMPRRSGISIYKELRSCPALSRIPVALISGMSPAASFTEEAFRSLAADDALAMPEGFIEKPVKIPALLERVAQLLKGVRDA